VTWPTSRPDLTAHRELEEEVGMRAASMIKLAEFYNSPGFPATSTRFLFSRHRAHALRHVVSRATRSST